MRLFTILLWGFIITCNSGYAFTQVDSINSTYLMREHPRLFFLKEQEQGLQKAIGSKKLLSGVHDLIIAESHRMLTMPLLTRNQVGRRILHTSREAIRRILFLSYSNRMTGNEKFMERAKAEMLNVASFENWNPTHFLDVAEMTLALSIGYDWLYDKLSKKDRNQLEQAIQVLGIAPSTELRYNKWLNNSNNWNQVCNGGLAAGAVAVFNIYPDESKMIINRAVATVPLSMHEYAENGGYPEGPHYWAYGTTYNLLLLDLLEQNFGSDFSLSMHPGFLNTADFMQHMEGHFLKSTHGATPKYFNFGDNHEGTAVEPAMFWFASKLKRPDILFTEARKLKYFLQNSPQKLLNDRFLPFLVLWSIDTDFEAISEPRQRMFIANGKTEVAMMRTSWSDNRGIYIGVKGGTPSASHQHMDIGSFVMEANGVRWAIDFGMQEYNSLESKGIDLWNRSQDSQRWEVFRYKNSSHNTLTINNKKQLVAGNATVEKISDTDKLMAVAVNMTPLYKNDVSELKRVISVVDQQYVQIEDFVQSNEKEANIRWNMLTRAKPEIIDEHTILLSEQGEKMMIQFSGNIKAKATITSTRSPNDYDAPNDGTVFVGFELTVPANSKSNWQVKLIP